MTFFEIGNVYSQQQEKFKKSYYIAVGHRTLVTYKNEKFGQYTTKKQRFIKEDDVQVDELCELWDVSLDKFDNYMSTYFQPDEEAKQRAHKEKEELEFQLQRELALNEI